jgi:hypothetical protein
LIESGDLAPLGGGDQSLLVHLFLLKLSPR